MVLDDIVAAVRKALEARKAAAPPAEIERRARNQPPPLDFAAALRGDDIRIIAEIKKASPSKGVIRHDFDPVAVARLYEKGGAAAISVLTEKDYFQGSLENLRAVRDAVKLPLLRKDFIFDPYQVYEARAYGADAVLLIAAILVPRQLQELLGLSRSLGMACLVEVHDRPELAAALDSGARIIGINNRNLKTFKVDLAITGQLRPLVPRDRIVVSESGIHRREDMAKLAAWGVPAVLVGEALMSAPCISAKLKELLTE